ncbi:hypothetical protein BT63DRAFT_432581 [Microthyrium microscopicum]|uniref:Glutamate--tRNA ligase, mitochondrial n=1 Tax=Microthyrium microscopicum TaxID=703497 RepID=A0A6A6UE82_9PEZI|nr:hypothetical protein BT63DRAFT_432581 [Microthyrium microscopicum]
MLFHSTRIIPARHGLSPLTTAVRFLSSSTLKPARTRFAPSPTGFTHLGSLRTALLNYLWAKKTGGQFILRIEDTDTKRTVPGAEQRIINDLQWAGLQWDEGPLVGGPHGPYKQSERVKGVRNIYREHAEELVRTGHAYRCFCSPQLLREKAALQIKQGLPVEYDGTCTNISNDEAEERAGESHIIRLIDKSPPQGFKDLVFGKIAPEKKHRLGRERNSANNGVLIKADGFPTYHMANVVDDHFMEITHVIRGAEWIMSTPKHLSLYRAFGWDPPEFAHVGLLRDKDMSKLSKRAQVFNLGNLKDEVLPGALMNYLALLGWKHIQGREAGEIFTLEDMVQEFDFKLKKSMPIVDLERLENLQMKHIKLQLQQGGSEAQEAISLIANAVRKQVSRADLASLGMDDARKLDQRIAEIIQQANDVPASTDKWIDGRRYLLTNNPPQIITIKASEPSERFLREQATFEPTEESIRTLMTEAMGKWAIAESDGRAFTAEDLQECLKDTVDKLARKYRGYDDELVQGQFHPIPAARRIIYKYLRAWITWGLPGPSLHHSMSILGYEICMQRITNTRTSAESPKDTKDTMAKPGSI